MSASLIRGPSSRYMIVGDRTIDLGSHWKRKKDGKVVEVVWMQDYRGQRVQVRPEGATNFKNTHWLDAENLFRLYDGWIPASTSAPPKPENADA